MLNNLYKIMVSKNETIKRKYEYYKLSNPERHKKLRLISWAYLAGLNAKYAFNTKHVKVPYPESVFSKQISLEKYKKLASKAAILSFDIFDTLVLRCIDHPTDVFAMMALQTGIADFKSMRISAEIKAREKAKNHEVSIYDIYSNMLGFSKDEIKHFVELEFEIECKVCFANPYLKTFFDFAINSGKKVIIVSDMYWPSEKLSELLEKCGYIGFDKVFVSCEHKCSKSTGELQRLVFNEYCQQSILHIGDVVCSDGKKFSGWKALIYRNVAIEGYPFRNPMTSMCGRIYNANVNAFLHDGSCHQDAYHEFGYVYGGLLSYGYCQFIDRCCGENQDAVILFTARDSEAFYNIYKKYFNHCDCEYAYCSREAMLKANLPFGAEIYYDIMFQAKTYLKEKITIDQAFEHAGIDVLDDWFLDYSIKRTDLLDKDSSGDLRDLVFKNFDNIVANYSAVRAAAQEYLKSLIGKHKKVYIVDLGWRGTVYILMRQLIKEMDPTISVEGFFVGSFDSDMAKTLIESGEMHSYAFSHEFNKGAMPIEHIMIVETLFSSYAPTTRGYKKDENGKPVPVFAELSKVDDFTKHVYDGLKDGIYDFCEKYNNTLEKLGVSSTIPGAEAFAPIGYVCRNYDYIMSLFGKLKVSDLAGEDDMSFKSVLNRLGYK